MNRYIIEKAVETHGTLEQKNCDRLTVGDLKQWPSTFSIVIRSGLAVPLCDRHVELSVCWEGSHKLVDTQVSSCDVCETLFEGNEWILLLKEEGRISSTSKDNYKTSIIAPKSRSDDERDYNFIDSFGKSTAKFVHEILRALLKSLHRYVLKKLSTSKTSGMCWLSITSESQQKQRSGSNW